MNDLPLLLRKGEKVEVRRYRHYNNATNHCIRNFGKNKRLILFQQSIYYKMTTDTLPYSGLRIVELEANLLSGRLTGMLFADQGAEVIILNSGKDQAKLTDGSDEAERRANDMLNRNKTKPKSFTSEVYQTL